jgi:hypothetical protein
MYDIEDQSTVTKPFARRRDGWEISEMLDISKIASVNDQIGRHELVIFSGITLANA